MNSPNDIIISDHFDTIKIDQGGLFFANNSEVEK